MTAERVADARVLAINPGSTSTKVSLFIDSEEIVSETIQHSAQHLCAFRSVAAQSDFRFATVSDFLQASGVSASDLDAVIARGGLLHPIESGVYVINDAMLSDLTTARYGEHASNLGAVLAARISADAECPAFIADPVVVDEMADVARLSGIPEIPRRSVFHALNQKSAAREAAARLGRHYEEMSIIVAHLGGGVSVGAHFRGRVIDVNNALDGEGPFAPERSGGVPAGQLVDFVLDSGLSRQEIKRKITGAGGIVAYCGTNNLMELQDRIREGDEKARLVFDALGYQISKEMAMHGATFSGSVDLIVITGGMANNDTLIKHIRSRIGYLAPIEVVPGEREMVSLAAAAVSVLRGETTAKEYTREA